eukprot:4997485-Alexandrium_andersonii.AAC.1
MRKLKCTKVVWCTCIGLCSSCTWQPAPCCNRPRKLVLAIGQCKGAQSALRITPLEQAAKSANCNKVAAAVQL